MSTPGGAQKPLRVGDLLVSAGLITEQQVQEAIAAQKSTGLRLGEVLINLGFVTEQDLASTLAQQLSLAFYPNPESEVDPLTARLVPESVARRYKAMPLKVEDGVVLLAMVDPTNFMAEEDIAMQTGRKVRRVVVTEKGLNRALIRAYGLGGTGAAANAATAMQEVAAAAEAPLIDQAPRVFDLDANQGNQTVRMVNTIIEQAVRQRASDIHIEPMNNTIRVRYRVDGVLTEANPLPRAQYNSFLTRVKVMAAMDIAERRIPQDGRIEVEAAGRKLDIRVSTVPTIYGEKLALRILDRSQGLRKLDELGLEPPQLKLYREMIHRPNGILLVTGPTGSGKTSTLMATLSELNKVDRNIMTVEDPVEYQIDGINQVQVNVKAGLTFAAGVRSFLRQDPNVIMVGEIRDAETADIAVRAAMTGHLVLSTLHTNSAAGAFGRLINMGVEPFLLASATVGVVAQRLVRRLCSRCKEPYTISPEDPAAYMLGEVHSPVQLFRARGCPSCDRTGYVGRLALLEILPVTNRIRELVARSAPAAEIEQAAVSAGMRTLWFDGVAKARAGLTTLEEVQRVAFMEE
jgi:type IV pilus assembly protein PilB